VTVKIRLGWNADHRNYLEMTRAIVDGGGAAITVHGRTREARYRQPSDWEAIAEVAATATVPVIGNGDLLFPHEIDHRLRTSGCAALMSARGVLIKPWLFREVRTGYWDITAEDRVALYRRYVELAREHWGRKGRVFEPATGGEPASAEPSDPTPGADTVDLLPVPRAEFDDHARARLREFLRWHVGFWVRYVPRRPDGSWPTMQQRESFVPRSPLEALLARTDDAAVDYITDQLLDDGDLGAPPEPGQTVTEPEVTGAG
jgi:hypothetical protein